ncbi:MAG: nucleoside-triphosphatase, partial [Desulfobacterales bacterium]|nr:nucleoside-triphosphatase [Desulfobacterales bacterium]
RAVLAHVDIRSPFRVGKYGVDVEALDRFIPSLACLAPATTLIIIDEIGKMECFSRQFCRSISHLLNSKIHVVATIAMRGHGLIADIKKRPDCELFLLTTRNRSHLHEQILNKIQ